MVNVSAEEKVNINKSEIVYAIGTAASGIFKGYLRNLFEIWRIALCIFKYLMSVNIL